MEVAAGAKGWEAEVEECRRKKCSTEAVSCPVTGLREDFQF